MFHPMHLHGHTVALAGNGTRKDTVNVLPKQSQSIDFDADNPGQWLMHCHNVYHGELGMMTNRLATNLVLADVPNGRIRGTAASRGALRQSASPISWGGAHASYWVTGTRTRGGTRQE